MAMGKKVRTSVVLTAVAEEILQKYRNGFGLKGPLSVGLELFENLDDAEKIRRVSEAEKTDSEKRKNERAMRAAAEREGEDFVERVAAEAREQAQPRRASRRSQKTG